MGNLLALVLSIFFICGFAHSQSSSLYSEMMEHYNTSDSIPDWQDFPDQGYLEMQCRFLSHPVSRSFSKIRFFIVEIGESGPLFPDLPFNKRIVPDFSLREWDCKADPISCTQQEDFLYAKAIYFETIRSSTALKTVEFANQKAYSFKKQGEYMFFKIDFEPFPSEKDQYGYCYASDTAALYF